MNRKYLIVREGTFYKANMHHHSTFSGGAFTSAELKKIYQSRGYSIIACTAPCIYKHHAELSDGNFLVLAGLKAETIEPNATEGGFDRVKNYPTHELVLKRFYKTMRCKMPRNGF